MRRLSPVLLLVLLVLLVLVVLVVLVVQVEQALVDVGRSTIVRHRAEDTKESETERLRLHCCTHSLSRC